MAKHDTMVQKYFVLFRMGDAGHGLSSRQGPAKAQGLAVSRFESLAKAMFNEALSPLQAAWHKQLMHRTGDRCAVPLSLGRRRG